MNALPQTQESVKSKDFVFDATDHVKDESAMLDYMDQEFESESTKDLFKVYQESEINFSTQDLEKLARLGITVSDDPKEQKDQLLDYEEEQWNAERVRESTKTSTKRTTSTIPKLVSLIYNEEEQWN